jgi:UPF0755 protein
MSPFPGEFSADEGLTRSEVRAKKRRRMMRRRRTTTIIVICILVFGIGGFFGVKAAGGVFDDLFGPKGDYEGQGTNEVSIEIAPGSSARTVANQLVEEGVIMNSEPFLDEVERREATIQAGTWTMREKMSSKAAVEALINPIAPPRITVAEGKQVEEIKAIMIESGMNADEVDKAIDDKTPKDYGLEIDAPESRRLPLSGDLRSEQDEDSRGRRPGDGRQDRSPNSTSWASRTRTPTASSPSPASWRRSPRAMKRCARRSPACSSTGSPTSRRPGDCCSPMRPSPTSTAPART